jgi:hypothetical protein
MKGARFFVDFGEASLLLLTPPQHCFPDRDARSGVEIDLGPILNNPAGLLKE